MCGIFGIINGKRARKADYSINKLLTQAFITGSLRGFDSSGLMQLDKGKAYWHKAAVNGLEFAKSEDAAPYLTDTDTARLTVCHNRAATQGAVDNESAHPFAVGRTMGVHNGSLTAWKSRPDGDKFTVDSEWALSRIDERGVDAFEEFTGPYCLVWHSSREDNKLYIARNEHRPMYVLFVKDEDRAIFCSEWRMMTWLCDRNDIKLEDEIIDIAPGKLYAFDISNPRHFVTSNLPNYKALPAPATTTTPARPNYTNSHYGRGYYGGNGMYDDDWHYYQGYDTSAEYVKEFLQLLTSEDENENEEEEVAPAPVIDVATSVAAAIREEKPKIRVIVTNEEQRLAKLAEELDREVTFFPEVHRGDTSELWGTIKFSDGTDTAGAVMRGVTASMFGALQRATGGVLCTVIGAMAPTNGDSSTELVYILGRNAKFTSVGENEPKSLSEQLAEELSEFVDRRRTSNTTTH